MRVLVTDSDTRPALAAIRTLGRRGFHVIAAGVRHPSIGAASRYAAASERYPDPTCDARAFVSSILEIANRSEVDVVLPITEITTLLVAEHQHLLPACCRVPFGDIASVAAAADKSHVIRLAEALHVPTPQTVVLATPQELRRDALTIGFPLVVKPARSRVRVHNSWISTGVSYARDEAELRLMLEGLPQEVYPVLLQERIEGPGVGVFSCFADGKPAAWFAHRRLREKPPSGGVSVLCESTPLDPDAVKHASRLLAALGWRGAAMVEFKQDARDGSLRLMEINGRFWGSLQLAIDAGVDFPSLAVAVARGEPLPDPPQYRIGVRSRWLAGDLDALTMMLLKSRARLQLPPSHPGRWRALWNFVNLRGKPAALELERSDDPAPARLEWRRRFLGA